MRLLDARRLRGPSLDTWSPGAVAEVALDEGEDADAAIAAFRRAVGRLAAAALGPGSRTSEAGIRVRRWPGGLALYVPAEIDLLMAAVDLLEGAFAEASGGERADAAALRRTIARATNVRLRELARAADAREVSFVFDDETATVGAGAGARSFALDRIPEAPRVPWREVSDVPTALVTGTNGKTTTTRLVARMAKLAGRVPGNTSSDGVAIDEEIVDPGDNTGGESARRVLRDPRVEVAILETARGGLLRRGLAMTRVDAALITNVSADHLGEHGIVDVDTLARAKAVVTHVVRSGTGRVVLGADDPQLERLPARERLAMPCVWFAASREAAERHVGRGETAFTIEDGAIVRIDRGERVVLAALDDVPVTDGGAATHNVKNALAAAALAWVLGIPDIAVIAALRTFGTSARDNPGRGQIAVEHGVRVLRDFGHNPAAASDLYAWARSLAGAEGRVHAVLTQPGDRGDDAIGAFARAVAASGVATVTVWETETLHRGRSAGEITDALVAALRGASVPVSMAGSESAATWTAIERARVGDVVVVSPSLDR